MESLSRISTLLETARDLTLEAAQSASITASARAPPTPSPTATKKLLNSRVDREVLDGLRKVISMMSHGTDCSPFFADVVKNVASPTLEIKKLVYIYLLRYAESEPDLALLSINTIQKALTDQSQLVRSMAIRVMAGIRVPVISQIVALGIKRCAADMSPYVRKAAAVAIPKCYRLDPGTLPALRECLTVLLADRSFYVVGAAVVAWEGVCPRSWEMLHGHYRALARMLIDMDEWGQLAVLRVLTGYARANFPAREQRVKKAAGAGAVKEGAGNAGGGDWDGFYSEESGDEGVMRGRKGKVVAAAMDADLELLLRSCIPLLQSRNSAVIVAVARLYTHLAPASSLPTVAGPLISLLRAPTDIQHIALLNIVSIALKTPQPFTPYTTHFLVHASDPPHIWKLKLELLTLIFPHTPARTKNLILSELEYFAHTPDPALVREAVRAIGRCAQSETRNAARCLKLLMRQVESGTTGTLVAESLTVIRHIILQNPGAHAHTVVRLAKALDTAVNPSARASIIWLVGEFAGANGGDNVAADTLRLLAKTFVLEGEAAKLQIVLLAAKVYAHYLDRTQSGSAPAEDGAEGAAEDGGEKHPVALLFGYITLLARYDQSYDLRDRARLYKSILSTPSSTPLATLLLLAPKPTPLAPSPSCGREKYTVGSAAMVVGGDEDVSGYEPLEDWVGRSRAPSPSVRDVAAVEGEVERRGGAAAAVSKKSAAAAGGGGGASPGMAATPDRSPVWRPEGVKVQQVKEVPETLEDFFKESEEEEEETEEEETEEEESEEESGEEEDEDEDDDDDEEEEESEDEGNEGSKL
ncbi:adaptin N terminal region-domain-containing protein [Morchella snyderi]|nr:adaptin N terminal region-domain-containing protein [Morchella snyderi]